MTKNKTKPQSKHMNNETPESLVDTGSLAVVDKEGGLYCLSIIGEIEGHVGAGEGRKATKYEHMLPLLFSIEESPEIQGVLILVNTVGGDVEAGLAIAELIASMQKPTVSIVLGGGHSIGVPLAVSARRSFIVKSATMTLHPVRMTGLVLGVPQSFDYLERMQNRIIRFVTEHATISPKLLRQKMTATENLSNDIGTILEGEEAVTAGLIDEVGGLTEALTALRQMIRGENFTETKPAQNAKQNGEKATKQANEKATPKKRGRPRKEETPAKTPAKTPSKTPSPQQQESKKTKPQHETPAKKRGRQAKKAEPTNKKPSQTQATKRSKQR